MSNKVTPIMGAVARFFTWGTSHATSAAAVSVDGNATTNANPIPKETIFSSFQAIVTGTGAVSATVQIWGTLDEASAGINGAPTAYSWVLLGTISLAGTTSATDGFTSQSSWRAVRAKVTAISGVGAAVQVLLGG